MQLAKIYMKSGNTIEIKCDDFEVITSGEILKNINFKRVINGEKPMFLDLSNVECITTKKIDSTENE